MNGPVGSPDGGSASHCTDDPAEAEAMMLSVGGTIGFRAGPDRRGGTGFRFALDSGGDPEARLGTVAIEGTWASDGGFSMFHVGHVERGDVAWDIAGERGRGAEGPFLVPPGARIRAHSDSMTVRGLYLDAELMRRVAKQTYDLERIEPTFASPRPSDPGRAAYLAELIRFADVARRTGALAHETVRAAVVQNLVVGVLECFPLAGDHQARNGQVEADGRTFRRGVRYLEDHASLPITVGDAAQALGLSVEVLDRVFRSAALMSSEEYLRRVRLSAAHQDLLTGDPAATSVRAIAHRWGFPSVGGFERIHLREYGVRPEVTLAV